MNYMLLIYGTEGTLTEDDRRDCMTKSISICDELAAQGKFRGASPLEPVRTAVSVRVREGRVLVTDGPFAETTEQLGGYYLLDLTDLDEAIAVASRLPPVSRGTIEIRPLLPMEGVPPARPLPAAAADSSLKPYLVLCYGNEAKWETAGPQALAAARAEAAASIRRLAEEGRFLSGSPLHPAATATSVRVRGGQRVVTDGPFAETHEVLGGYYLILAEDRASAVRFAAEQPGARVGTMEVRPLFDMSVLKKPS
jgi:hypothetical protein